MRIDKRTVSKIVTTANRQIGTAYRLFKNDMQIVSITPNGVFGDTSIIIEALILDCGLDINTIRINPDPRANYYYYRGIGGSLKNSTQPVDSNFLATSGNRHDFDPVPGTPLYVQKILYYFPYLFRELLRESNLNFSTDDIYLEVDGLTLGNPNPLRTERTRFVPRVPESIDGYADSPYYSNIYYEEDVSTDLFIPGLVGFLREERKKIFDSEVLNQIDEGIENTFKHKGFFDIPIILSKDTPVKEYELEPEDIPDDPFREMNRNDNNITPNIHRNRRGTYTERILGTYDPIRHIIILYYRNVECRDEEQYMATFATILSYELFQFLHHMYIEKMYFTTGKEAERVIVGTASSFSLQYADENARKYRGHYGNAFRKIEKYYITKWLDLLGTNYPYAYALYLYDIRRLIYVHTNRISDIIRHLTFYCDYNKFYSVIDLSRNNMIDAYHRLLY